MSEYDELIADLRWRDSLIPHRGVFGLAADAFESVLAQVAEQQAVIEWVRESVRCKDHGGSADQCADCLIQGEMFDILSTSGTEALEAVRAAAWDECLDAIEKHELNTKQARSDNPHRKTGGQSNG